MAEYLIQSGCDTSNNVTQYHAPCPSLHRLMPVSADVICHNAAYSLFRRARKAINPEDISKQQV